MPGSEHNFMHNNVEVPMIIEIASQSIDSLECYDYCTDDDSRSQTEQTEEDHVHDYDRQKHDDKYDVSRQDLDALKRMVRVMMANPDLLYKSPVFSRVAVKSASNRITPIHVESSSSAPPELALRVPSSVTSSGMRLTPMQDILTCLCQECEGDNTRLSSRSIDQDHRSMFPTLPFNADRV